ncbi:hypothetical protein P4U99_26140 [Brevibacillus agri]|uniref:hypothetical protein n=1 Tax=Brevibacillus agri TaxID=51101 RepID=UPI000686C5DB|nr:hypothetical protein [Brevibacillus agri]MBY0051008.1 hypothetical protein [Brevibacillus agri]MDN4095949.1 hypothetical protein [Brevibacillus agri]MED1646600.1 hypothetical protein [Brevibacillus agri]MED1657467.1 hypothetical protein [Brevibacillus agri]MED1689988.1 hypothetical protein [Brevibacillus agri]
MKETLLVKHAVGGRTFVDSSRQAVAYQVQQAGEGWKFVLSGVPVAVLEEILKWKDELNVFLFQEEAGQPVKKIWFYVKDGPVTYDAAAEQLTIAAESRIEYVPDKFGSSA